MKIMRNLKMKTIWDTDVGLNKIIIIQPVQNIRLIDQR